MLAKAVSTVSPPVKFWLTLPTAAELSIAPKMVETVVTPPLVANGELRAADDLRVPPAKFT